MRRTSRDRRRPCNGHACSASTLTSSTLIAVDPARFRQSRRSVTLHHFMCQLGDLAARLRQRGPARIRDRVVLAHLAADHPLLPAEIAVRLHAMQDGVDRSWADLIVMPAQLLDHRQAVDGLLRGVMQDVDLDEAEKEIPEHCVTCRYR